jgi:hypothetical protein
MRVLHGIVYRTSDRNSSYQEDFSNRNLQNKLGLCLSLSLLPDRPVKLWLQRRRVIRYASPGKGFSGRAPK